MIARKSLAALIVALTIAGSASAQTVYVGATGNKYHGKNCSTLKGKGRPMSLADAKAQGRTACKWPGCKSGGR